ncbi:MAG: GTP-binding protein [Candidatus Heimdallarchaeota archaeon]|nr:GTP-binding protein [Candidatus Heimdallarchaeota archaeon]
MFILQLKGVNTMAYDSDRKPKYHLKLIVTGGGAVGKTSLVRRYVDDKFDFNYLLTVGMDPTNRLIEINGLLVNLIIFDVAGQERFQTLREVFFRKAHGALLVFDLTRSDTLDELYTWKEQIDSRLGEDLPKILVGNKCDLEEEIQIDYETLEDHVIQEFKPLKYIETSAYLDKNVREVFTDLTREILSKQGII